MRKVVRSSIGLFLSALLAGCQVVGSKPPVGQRVAQVKRGSIVETVNPTGVVVAGTTANLNFPVGGILVKYDVALGQKVKQGQVLAELDSSEQAVAVSQAKASLALAMDKLAGVRQVQPGALAQAQGNLAAAKAKLAAIQQGPRAADVVQAKAALDAAEQKLAQMKAGPKPAAVAQAQANVASAQTAVDMAQTNLDAAQKNGPFQVQQAEAKLQSAKDALFAAQTSRDGICGGHGTGYQCQAANANVNSAQDNVNAAVATLAQQRTASKSSVTSAENSLAQAKAQLAAAQSALVLVEQPYSLQDLAQQADAVAQTQAALELAERPYTAADLAEAQAGVTAAKGALQNVQEPYTPSDLAQAKDAGQAAQADLQAAEINLDHTKLRAPFDGTVLSEPLSPGDFVGTNANPIGLGTTGLGLEVNASVDEVDISKIRVGQPVTISAVAVPGKLFPGRVAEVPPQGTTVLNVVTYPTFISLDDGQDLLKPGMTVSTTIDVVKHTNALVVPTAAVSDINGKTFVMLPSPNGGKPVAQLVTTGIASLTQTEILSGLKVGDEVLLGVSPKKITVGPRS